MAGVLSVVVMTLFAGAAFTQATNPPDTVTSDIQLPYSFDDNSNYMLDSRGDSSLLFLRPPSNISTGVEYDPESNQYIFRQKIGDLDYRNPAYMSFDEFQDYQMDRLIKNYWREKSKTSSGLERDGIIPSIYIGGEVFDRIFGSNTIDIRPNGSAELTFGVLANSRDDPTLDVRQRRTANFDFQNNIQMNVSAKIGDKISFNTNFNTEAIFDFENKLKLNYEGKEDEIIKLIEAGNVSMPLNTTLIRGTQSLFGVKAKLQFGKTTVTGLFSQQESESSTVTIEDGAQQNEFQLRATDYEENKHFFLGHLFRDAYDDALSELPIVNSSININRIEVWVTNIGPAVEENRNVVAFQDLGEYDRIYNEFVDPKPGGNFPSNNSNNLIDQMNISALRDINNVTNYLQGDPFGIGQSGYMVAGSDFEKIESARKLNPSEYSLNTKLGFISLYSTLTADQALAVAIQYSVIGQDSVFQIGEFSDQTANTNNCLVVKLLKSTAINVDIPMWDLMMKNVYSIGAYRINRENFIFNILYSGNDNGVPTGYLDEGPEDVSGVPLIEVLNLDNLDAQLNPPGDGVFDFIDNAATNGGTINSQNGRIYFTVTEPFGEYLRQKFGPEFSDEAELYTFDTLYRSTKIVAEQQAEKNLFILEGFYSSESGNEIDLNAFNIPRGSVKVTAGGRVLQENVDYTVDYTLGRVRIINDGILNSGVPINISTENQAMFSVVNKRLMGLNFDHQYSKNFRFGGTIMNLHERPLTQKVDYGNDPISNTIWGLDFSYQTESQFITNLVDKLPGIEAKEPSKVNVEGEFAHFIPGHSKAIGKQGIVYIDDFEGAKSTIDLRNVGTWFLASTPQGQDDLFPEAQTLTRAYGYNRAKLAWYVVDPLFYDRNNNLRPANVSKENISDHRSREVLETEVFPNKDNPNGIPTNIPVFNMAFYPEERGPYNYDVEPTSFSRGLEEDGTLVDPETRWGGIMRRIESTDFEATNVEYIEFWLMDPFNEDANQNNPGKLYINIGDISEDILKDSRKSFENGLPTSEEVENVETTIWGRVSTLQNLVESFDNNEASRPFQDVGYDGLSTNDERIFFDEPYIQAIAEAFGSASDAYFNAIDDPSADNFHYFRGSDYDVDPDFASVLNRYKKFNGPDGNSPTDLQNPEEYPTAGTTIPNVEDLNRDNTLSEAERYFQYEIELDPSKMEIGENFITDIRDAKGVPTPDGRVREVKWYQFKVPITRPDKVVGNISNFRAIRFIRMFMRDFEQPVVLRFATLELVRGEWRRYLDDLLAPGEYIPDDIQALTSFDVFSVNIEENGRRFPVNYVIPPGIERETNLGATTFVRLNEQSLSLRVCDLIDGDARAIFKTTQFDFRQYKRLQMFVHAEKIKPEDFLDYGDLTVFIRVGTDFQSNYYEYEVPLTFTEWGSTIPEEIWPASNKFDIDLARLVETKLNRDVLARDPTNGVSINYPYVEFDGENKITVLGVPTISDVMAIMIGVRNPKQMGIDDTDDGLPKCAEIWVNELRLTNFNDRSGWAAIGRVTADLATLGRVAFSASHSSAHFGSLENKINQINLESNTQFDIATDLNLGQFFPEQAGVRIPMHFDYSQMVKTPYYNPLNPDIRVRDEYETYEERPSVDSVKSVIQDYTQRRSINFINVRKDRVGSQRKPQVWDIENFNFSYAYTNLYKRNIDIAYDNKTTHNGGLGYNFSTSPKNVKPFSKIGFLADTEALRFISDFNFFFLPKSFGFRTDMVRDYQERLLRDKSAGDIIIRPTFMKKWDWNRNYDLKFDLATSLTLQFRAVANAFIREAPGSTDPGSPWYDQEANDSIDFQRELLTGGTMRNYRQTFDVNYKIPIDKFPYLDWITGQFTYGSTYDWQASPVSVQERIGNVIQNAQTIQLNGNFDFSKLFGYINYLDSLNRSSGQGQSQNRRLNNQRGGAQQQQQQEAEDADTTGRNIGKAILDGALRFLMMAKRASFTYSQSNGTGIPGFLPNPTFLGLDMPRNQAPGLGFVFGSQADIRQDAALNGWITQDSALNQAYTTKFTENLSAKATLEPFPGFRIEINADRVFAKNHTEFFRYADSVGNFVSYNPIDAGSFSMSYIAWGTAFNTDYNDIVSANFEKMKEVRWDVAQRLSDENPNSSGTVFDSITGLEWPVGYGPTSQDVLIPSFFAAYTNQSTSNVALDYFPRIPLPNWRITYDGLARIGVLRGLLQNASISHGYRSTYAIGSYQTNLSYGDQNTGFPAETYDDVNAFYPVYDVAQVTIVEQFSPLIGIDLTWTNSLTTRFEMKKSRNLTFSMANKQLTDVNSDEIIVGLGYRIKDVSFTMSSIGSGRRTNFSSDLDIKADFSIRNNRTVLRRLDTSQDQISSGMRVVSINTTIDYALSSSLSISFFFDKIINNPFVSNQYRNSTTRGGFRLRFSLAQ
jgi:cell surface protein SprA